MSSRVLFLLKRREDVSEHPSYSQHGISTGLLNSATFMHDMLVEAGVESQLKVVIDNNCIDRAVTQYKPTHVIIEALWVVPEKFDILQKLHPNVTWIIRFHSETPFIASEGIAMRWLHGYVKHPNVVVAANAPRFMAEMQQVLAASGLTRKQIKDKLIYLPNYYPVGNVVSVKPKTHNDVINISCFGAVRPLKNHLLQAVAALEFAESIGKKLHFHINVGRVEMKGDPILHNIQGLFAGLEHKGHKLITHQWSPHAEFLEVIAGIDIGMQVSFSETFNIVAADMITSGVPVVMSSEVPWAIAGLANPVESKHIVTKLKLTWLFRQLNVTLNTLALKCYVNKTRRKWLKYFNQK